MKETNVIPVQIFVKINGAWVKVNDYTVELKATVPWEMEITFKAPETRKRPVRVFFFAAYLIYFFLGVLTFVAGNLNTEDSTNSSSSALSSSVISMPAYARHL